MLWDGVTRLGAILTLSKNRFLTR